MNDYTEEEEALITRYYRRMAFPMDYMYDWDFAHDDGCNPAMTTSAQKYVTNFKDWRKKGMGMFLFGGSNSGKSYYAAEIVNALTDKGYDCLFTSLHSILTRLHLMRFEEQRPYLFEIFHKQLLVLDDFGNEGNSIDNNSLMLFIIDTLYQKRTPLIVTTPFREEILLQTTNPARITVLRRLSQRCYRFFLPVPKERRLRQQRQLEEMGFMLEAPGKNPPEPVLLE